MLLAHPTAEIGEDHTPETHRVPLILDAALGAGRKSTRIRHRLSNSRWHGPARLCTRLRFGTRSRLSAAIPARRRQDDRAKFGRWPRRSVQEVIHAVRSVTGLNVAVRWPRTEAAGQFIVIDRRDATAARKLLGWSTECSDLRTIIADAWHWHRKRFANSYITAMIRSDTLID